MLAALLPCFWHTISCWQPLRKRPQKHPGIRPHKRIERFTLFEMLLGREICHDDLRLSGKRFCNAPRHLRAQLRPDSQNDIRILQSEIARPAPAEASDSPDGERMAGTIDIGRRRRKHDRQMILLCDFCHIASCPPRPSAGQQQRTLRPCDCLRHRIHLPSETRCRDGKDGNILWMKMRQ